MKPQLLIHSVALLMFVLSAPGATLDSRRIVNVEAQFANLQYHGEALSWHRAGVADDATATASPCKHYQGGARDPRPGPAYFYFTRNGNPSGACAGASTDPGEFVVVKLASREGDGEALRSNRLRRGEAQENTIGGPGKRVTVKARGGRVVLRP